MPKAKAAALKALELDPTLGEAHASRAGVLLGYDWDFPSAEREFKRAIELSPNYPTAHLLYGILLLAMGREEEAIREQRRALELDPFSMIVRQNLCRALGYAHHYDEAIAEGRRVHEMDPNFSGAYLELGRVFMAAGNKEAALAEFHKGWELSPDRPMNLALIGNAEARTGNRVEAMKSLGRLTELSKHRYIPAVYFAVVYTGLEQKDQAFAWLEKAYQDRCNFLVLLKVQESMDSLRSDPRFQDLLRRVGLPP